MTYRLIQEKLPEMLEET